ncbi:hypothetical protein TNCV_2551051 [Trichonephila clavipes]|nr:hypothetical protein TNCV_2551051 [Trichonephila clavipes]
MMSYLESKSPTHVPDKTVLLTNSFIYTYIKPSSLKKSDLSEYHRSALSKRPRSTPLFDKNHLTNTASGKIYKLSSSDTWGFSASVNHISGYNRLPLVGWLRIPKFNPLYLCSRMYIILRCKHTGFHSNKRKTDYLKGSGNVQMQVKRPLGTGLNQNFYLLKILLTRENIMRK